MKAVLRLAWAWARQYRGRIKLTTAAIAISAALVVFTISGYRAAIDRSAGFAGKMLGSFDLVIMPQYAIEPMVSKELETQLQADSSVARVIRTEVIHGDIEDTRDTTYYDSWRTTFIMTIGGSAPVELADGRWPSATIADGAPVEVTLSGSLARRWRVSIGDSMPAHVPSGQQDIVIVGLTDEVLAHRKASGAFISPAGMARLTGGTTPGQRLYVDLQEGQDSSAWVKEWSPRLAASQPATAAHDLRAFVAELGAEKAVKRLRSMGGAAAAIVLLAAAFIIATSMAAGAAERRRQLALLRTIGATRKQILQTVLLEASCLTVLGTAIGIPLGWLALQGLALAKPDLFGGMIAPDLVGPLGALVTCLACGICAGMAPAIAASRVNPVDAMSQSLHTKGPVLLGRRALIATALFILAVGLQFVGNSAGVVVLLIVTVISLSALACSAVLAAPLCLLVVERLVGGKLAQAAGLPGGLLRQQGGAHLARATGTVLTLAVCLGLSITMNVWGRSMVIPFLPAPELPDVTISLLPKGLPDDKLAAIPAIDGLQADRVLPLTVEQTLIGQQLREQTGGEMDQIYVQIIGADPEAMGLDQERPLLPLQSDKDLSSLTAALSKPNSCVVPPSFAQRFGLSLGDQLPLARCGHSAQAQELSFTIVGIASMPGWQWITKMGRMRSIDGKPLAPIIVSTTNARALGIPTVRHWLADTTDSYDRQRVRGELQKLADAHSGDYDSAHFGMGKTMKPSAKLIGTGEVGGRLQAQADKVIWVLGAIPLVSLLVAALGVANAVAMGIRSRSWEFGVLRAIGLESKHGGRLILTEATIVTLAAALLSIIYGITAAWLGIAISLQAWNAGTGLPPLIIPWLDIIIAILITLAVCLLASWLPGKKLASSSAQDLLQAGRSSC